MYNSLIHLYPNYAVLNWGRACKTAIQLLESLQNKAIKFLKTFNDPHLGNTYSHNNILTISQLFELSVGKFMHSFENNFLPTHFNQYYSSVQAIHNYPTRFATSQNFFLPRVHSSQAQCTFKFIGPKIWSEIHDHIKSLSASPFGLKKHYKNYLLEADTC